jgi:hypothetical protein
LQRSPARVDPKPFGPAQKELAMSIISLNPPHLGHAARQQPEIASTLARDQDLLETLYRALSNDIVFRTGPVRVARRDWSIELLTIDGRIGAWLVEGKTLSFFQHEDLLENDFVPSQDPDKALFRAADVRNALQQSRLAIAPYLKSQMARHA